MKTYTITFTEQDITTIIKALDIAKRYVVESACNGELTEEEANERFRVYHYVDYDIREATNRPLTF